LFYSLSFISIVTRILAGNFRLTGNNRAKSGPGSRDDSGSRAWPGYYRLVYITTTVDAIEFKRDFRRIGFFESSTWLAQPEPGKGAIGIQPLLTLAKT